VLAGHRERGIAGQPVPPIYPGHAQSLVEQQRPEAGAVDEELAGHRLAALEPDAGQVAGRGFAQDLANLSFDALDAARLGEPAQERGIQRGIEVVGVT
jgi:hypothetical protein